MNALQKNHLCRNFIRETLCFSRLDCSVKKNSRHNDLACEIMFYFKLTNTKDLIDMINLIDMKIILFASSTTNDVSLLLINFKY